MTGKSARRKIFDRREAVVHTLVFIISIHNGRFFVLIAAFRAMVANVKGIAEDILLGFEFLNCKGDAPGTGIGLDA